MATLFLICAVAGGTLFVCQFVMLLLGVGHHDVAAGHHGDAVGHHDAHGTSAGSMVWHLLNLRSIVAAVAVFGLAGMAAQSAKLTAPLPVLTGVGGGLIAAILAAVLTSMLRKFDAEGTAHIESARGATGTVYIPIPGDSAGSGRVQLELQNRIVELSAVTPKSSLETGTKIVVVDVVDPDTVEVIAVPQRSTV